MAESKFESVFKLTSKYKFHVAEDSLNYDLICMICKNVISDAIVNTACDCRYCYNCINSYADGERKHCPGGKKDCNEEYVVLGVTACRSIKLNRRISELKVNCPNHLCLNNVELKDMDNHLRFCTKKSMECPYIAIGCISEVLPKDELDLHMQSDALQHSQQMIDLIQNMRNEMNELKNNVVKGTEKIESLEEELLQVRNECEIRVNELMKYIKDTLTESIDAIKLEGASLRVELEKARTDHILKVKNVTEECEVKINEATEFFKKTLDNVIDMNKLEIASIKKKLERKEVVNVFEIDKKEAFENSKKTECIDSNKLRIVFPQNELERKENRIVSLEEELKQVRVNEERIIADAKITREAVGDGLDKMRADMTKYVEESGRKMNNLVILCPSIDADYVWRIDGYSAKSGRWVDGESFYSQKYKLSLSVNICGDGRVSLRCWIMKGEEDDGLIWPMEGAVTIGIVNQLSLMTDTSETRDTAFDRPKTDRGGYLCAIVTITDEQSVVVNDSIAISCVIRSGL